MREETKTALSKAELKIGASGYSYRDWGGARCIFTGETLPPGTTILILKQNFGVGSRR